MSMSSGERRTKPQIVSMRALVSTCFRDELTAVALRIVVCCGFVGLGTAAVAQESVQRPASPGFTHGLQGMRFIGSLGVEHQTGEDEEVLTFEDGAFSSDVCLKYGYPPAPYWVRRDAEGLHFLANLENPGKGTIRFEGVFDGKGMRATALWTKERWYWTIEQTLVFEGRAFEPPE